MCAPHLKTCLRSTESKDSSFEPTLKFLDDCRTFTLSSEREVQNQDLSILQHSLVTLVTSTDSLNNGELATGQDISSLVSRAVEIQGPASTLRALTGVLLQLSDSHQFLFALDAVTTVICTAGHDIRDALRLQYHNLGGLLKAGDTLAAEAVVRLYRQVEAYTNLLTVQDMGLDTFTFAQQLTDIDTANPNLDAVTAISAGVDMQTDEGQADGIDQVLDEVAAMGNLESNDADMSFDALYGLQGNDMDLNDLDLDMF